MDSRTRRRKRRFLVAVVCAVAWASPLQARVLEVSIERVSMKLGLIDGLTARVAWPDGATAGELTLEAHSIDAAELGYRYRNVRWQCPLQQPEPKRFRCEGGVRARGAGSATLTADWTDGELELTLSAGRGQFAVNVPAAADAPVRLQALRVPMTWLQPLLTPRWSEGRLTGGRSDFSLEVRRDANEGVQIAGTVAFAQLGLDSVDGRIAAAALDAQGRLAVNLLPDSTTIDAEVSLKGGELLMGPLYASLPESPIAFGLTLRSASAAAWSVERFFWKDPGVLELAGVGTIDPGSAAWLRSFDGTLLLPAVRAAHARYLDTLLGTLGLAKLDVDGALRAQLALREGRAVEVDVSVTAISAKDGAQRFALQGLDGRLRWTTSETPVESELRWSSARIYDVELGAFALPLQSSKRGLSLRSPVSLPVLGGEIDITRFAWRPAAEVQRTAALDLALDLDRLDLARLSQALGWPAFPGTLSGRIPGVRYADEVLSFEGGLGVEVFDGKLDIAAMTLERPLGVAPTMTAELAFAGLDLKPLTGAFGFGEITGRLDGHVRDLRLVDWSPVAFDADLHTSTSIKGPKRISQRAVNDLSRVGGAGIVAGLQHQMLRLFDTFGYARIGLRCRLRNNVCHMDGVDSSGGGYTIVEGSGLPRITVIGHQRQVDWPVLIARLKAATEGQTPIVQ